MKTYFVTACVLLIFSDLSAREFTDKQGRRIEADIVLATPDQVTLRMGGTARMVTSRVDIFSDADQKFIREFAAANVKYTFEVRYEKKKKDEKKVDTGALRGSAENWFYRISLKNISSVDAEGVTVAYSIYTKEAAARGRNGPRVAVNGSAKLGDVSRNVTALIETDTVEVTRVRPAPGFYFTSGEGTKSDQLAGFALKFTKDGKEVFSYATEPSFSVSGPVLSN